MSTDNRPLSPHLQVYRLPLTVVLSITHRLTGVFLALGTLMIVWILVAAASGPDAYGFAHGFTASWFGQLLFLSWTYALFFHLCNGIRHLVWDTGHGFELSAIDTSSWLVLIISVLLTALVWIVVLMTKGGV